jgi:hypothetical protein
MQQQPIAGNSTYRTDSISKYKPGSGIMICIEK